MATPPFTTPFYDLQVEFIVVADTMTVNSSSLLKDKSYGKWSFPHYKNVTQSNVIEIMIII